jgi:hypothetical protein
LEVFYAEINEVVQKYFYEIEVEERQSVCAHKSFA